jgi:hypothetical protein
MVGGYTQSRFLTQDSLQALTRLSTWPLCRFAYSAVPENILRTTKHTKHTKKNQEI